MEDVEEPDILTIKFFLGLFYGVCSSILILENNGHFGYQNTRLSRLCVRLPDHVAGNKRLQWRSSCVPVTLNNREHISYSTRHKTRTFIDGDLVLVLALVSHLLVATVFFVFFWHAETHYFITCNNDTKLVDWHYWLKDSYKGAECCVQFLTKTRQEHKFPFCKFFSNYLRCLWRLD